MLLTFLLCQCRSKFPQLSVAGFAWNGWQLSNGISGRLHLEYAAIIGRTVYWAQLGPTGQMINKTS